MATRKIKRKHRNIRKIQKISTTKENTWKRGNKKSQVKIRSKLTLQILKKSL
jgi:hypothetical protein